MFGKRLSLVLVVLCGALSAQAYEEDTHYSLTYVLMRLACFSHAEALTIASADQGLDDNEETDPALASEHNRKWHALDDSRAAVLARKSFLFSRASASKNLVDLGQYFHYQQDHWSHRKVKGENWEPYGPTIGHAIDFHQPDRVPWDKETARNAARETFNDAKRYLKDVLGRTPSDTPDTIIDALIDAQCRAYTKDALGNWNQANPDDVAGSLDAIARKLYLEGEIKKPIESPRTERKVHLVFDDGGAVVNVQEVTAIMQGITDYNLGTPGSPPPDAWTPTSPPTLSTTDHQTGSYQGTEWTADVMCSFKLELTEETKGGPIEWCYRTCRGGKHATHAECDPSCNDNCHLSHGDDILRAHCEVQADAVRGAIPEMETGPLPGYVWGPAQQKVQQRLAEMVRLYSQATFTPPMNHFSVFCGCSMRQYGYRKFKLIMVTKILETMKPAGGSEQKITKTAETVAAFVWQPDGRKPLVQKDFVNCVCAKTSTAMVPTKTGGPLVTQPCPGPQAIGTDNPNAIPPIMFTGVGIDQCTVPMPPPGTIAIKVFIPAGTRLIADNATYQVLVVMANTTISVAPNPPPALFASLVPNVQPEQMIPVACGEFNKKPPQGVPYKLGPPSSHALMQRIGVAAERQAMKGAWDQERTWIATDQVSLEAMRKRLVPPPSRANYLNSLWDLATMCWVDVQNEPFHALMQPDLVLDHRASPGAAQWFIGQADALYPNQMAALLIKDGPATMSKLDSATTPYAVALMKGLKNAADPALHAAIPPLLDAMPASVKASVMRQVFPAKSP